MTSDFSNLKNCWLAVNLIPTRIFRSQKPLISLDFSQELALQPQAPISCYMFGNSFTTIPGRRNSGNTPFPTPEQMHGTPFDYSRISNTTKEAIIFNRCTTVQCLLSKQSAIEGIFNTLYIMDQCATAIPGSALLSAQLPGST